MPFLRGLLWALAGLMFVDVAGHDAWLEIVGAVGPAMALLESRGGSRV